jgi:hypothetical protein
MYRLWDSAVQAESRAGDFRCTRSSFAAVRQRDGSRTGPVLAWQNKEAGPDVHPAYLTDIFSRIAAGHLISRISALMPWGLSISATRPPCLITAKTGRLREHVGARWISEEI